MKFLWVCACDVNITQINVMGTHCHVNHIATLMVNNFLSIKFEETNFGFELLCFFRNELSLCSMRKNLEKLLILEVQRMLR